MIDLRRLRIGIEVGEQMQFYEGLRMRASGTKYANPTQNECEVTISGLRADTRNFLLTETSPFGDERKKRRLTVEAGRVSTGLFVVFIGDITDADVSPPPDVTLTLRAKTNNANNAKVLTYSADAIEKLSIISQRVANDNGLTLLFQAKDKNIANFSHSGTASQMVRRLSQAGEVRAFVDDDALIVKDYDDTVSDRVRMLNKDSGMVGIPMADEHGIEVTYLADNTSELGGKLRVQSKMNPALDGDYVINQLRFELATHEDPWFYTALGERI